MKKSFVLTIAASLIFVLTAPVNAAPAPKPPEEVIVVNDASSPVQVEAKNYRYAGNSTGSIFPHIGISGMHETCAIDFGPSARMCTTTEVFETPKLSIPPSTAWVQPIVSDFIVNGTEVHYLINGVVVSQSVAVGIFGVNCHSWRIDASPFLGTVIQTNGVGEVGINYDSCNNKFLVACCLPQ